MQHEYFLFLSVSGGFVFLLVLFSHAAEHETIWESDMPAGGNMTAFEISVRAYLSACSNDCLLPTAITTNNMKHTYTPRTVLNILMGLFSVCCLPAQPHAKDSSLHNEECCGAIMRRPSSVLTYLLVLLVCNF